MYKKLLLSISLLVILVIIDQYIKSIFVGGFTYHTKCISLILAYNKGVAFSMFSFLAEKLKYIQIVILISGVIYILVHKNIFQIYYIPISLILAGGISNIIDRFIHIGVVDYVYWHCGFDFAIFNFADVIIDIGIAIFIWLNYKINNK